MAKSIEEQRERIRQELKSKGINVSIVNKKPKKTYVGKYSNKKANKNPSPKKKKKKNNDKRRKKYSDYLNSSKWKAFKRKLIKERGDCCQVCNKKKRLDAHHLTYKNIFKEKKEDILLVCRECHQKIHKRKF